MLDGGISSTAYQFKGQEPGTDDEVLQFCQMNYGVTFPIAKKVCLPESVSSSRRMREGDVLIRCLPGRRERTRDTAYLEIPQVKGGSSCTGYRLGESFAPGAGNSEMLTRSSQNFSKFLVKGDEVRWFPAKSSKVVRDLLHTLCIIADGMAIRPMWKRTSSWGSNDWGIERP